MLKVTEPHEPRFFGRDAAIVASLLAGIANLPFNVMPLILGVAADAFHLIPTQMGLLGAAMLMGWVGGTLFSFFALHRLNWRFAALGGVGLITLGLQASLHVQGVIALDTCWFVLGLGAALPTCVAFEILGQTATPERSFGMMTLTVVLASALVLWLFPLLLIGRWGYAGLVNGLTACFLLQTFLIPGVPVQGFHSSVRRASRAKLRPAALIAVTAFLIFFTGESGLWAFLERAGREIGLGREQIGVILALLKVIGGIACLSPIILATRLGNRWPFVVGFGASVVAVLLLASAANATLYAAGAWLWEFFFTVMFCYSNGLISRLDTSGRIVVLVPGAIGLGGAAGPAIAGYLKPAAGFVPIYVFTLACILVSGAVMLVLLHREGGCAARMAARE